MNKTFGIGMAGAFLLPGIFPTAANAACSNSAPASGDAVTCQGSDIAPVAAQTGSTTVTITADPTVAGNIARTVKPVIFSVETSSSITNQGSLTLTGGGGGGAGTSRGAVLLGNGNNNQLINAGGAAIVTSGAYNDGMAANGSGNTLTNNGTITTSGPNAYDMTAAWGQTNQGQTGNTLSNTGSVSTSGSNARAVSILGGSGTIDNSGALSTTGAGSPTAYMQGDNDRLLNSGTITAIGSGSDAVFSNTAGSNFTATIENQAGGQIVSQSGSSIRTLNGNSTVVNAGLVQSNAGTAITQGNGNDSLILQTGSVIVGSADGGAGNNSVTLQGNGAATNAFTRYQTLLMQGTQWDWTGTGTFSLAHVQSGTFNLTGSLGDTSTTLAQIDAGATLQANAGNLPLNVSDNGLVRFAQNDDGSYAGQIAGSGALEKTGAGMLTLAPATANGNTYTGGTTITEGTLATGADNALGDAAGPLAFNGGTLQLTQSFDLAASRAITLDAGGGTIDTQSFASTLSQAIAGTGALTKAGSGSLVLNGVSTYSGGTTIAAGTLALNAVVAGDGAASDRLVLNGGHASITGCSSASRAPPAT